LLDNSQLDLQIRQDKLETLSSKLLESYNFEIVIFQI